MFDTRIAEPGCAFALRSVRTDATHLRRLDSPDTAADALPASSGVVACPATDAATRELTRHEVLLAAHDSRVLALRVTQRFSSSRSAAEEAVGAALGRLLPKLVDNELRFFSARAVGAWLVGTARWVAWEQHRDAKRHISLSVPAPESVQSDHIARAESLPCSNSETPEHIVAQRELIGLLGTLSEADQRLLFEEAMGERDGAASGQHRRRVHLARERARGLLRRTERARPGSGSRKSSVLKKCA